MTPYYVIHDQDDRYVSDADHDDVVWVPSGDDPMSFRTLQAAVAFIEATGLDTDVVEVQIVTPPAEGSIVKITSSGTWCGSPLRDRLALVEWVNSYPDGALLTVRLWDGWYREGTPAWGSESYLWAHEVVPAQLPEPHQAAVSA